MRQRGITRDEVESVMANHHTAYTDRDGKLIYMERPGGRRIKVVVAKKSNSPLVITAAD